jgi:hypothetical protein
VIRDIPIEEFRRVVSFNEIEDFCFGMFGDDFARVMGKDFCAKV